MSETNETYSYCKHCSKPIYWDDQFGWYHGVMGAGWNTSCADDENRAEPTDEWAQAAIHEMREAGLPYPKEQAEVSKPQKYKKISIIVDDGETTHIQTFYRTREFSYGMENLDPDISRDVMVYGISFKAERDNEKACVSTTQVFQNEDSDLYIQAKDGRSWKLGL
jgi:hypothetical protein